MTSSRAALAVLLVVGLSGGAEAATVSSLASPLPASALPVPPRPPLPGEAEAKDGFAPAPVPDPDVRWPRADTEQPHTQVTPSLFDSPKDRAAGSGFLPGSAAQYDPDRRLHPSPGITVKVPLQ
jgi:hypothetical protein